MRRRLANAYLLFCSEHQSGAPPCRVSSMILVNAKAVTDYFKQNLQVSVIMQIDLSRERCPDVPQGTGLMGLSMVRNLFPKSREKRKWRICSERIF